MSTIVAYRHPCPSCEGLALLGSIHNPGGWLESKCTRTQCRQFFHLGSYPPNTPDRASSVSICCPRCSKKFGHGQFAPTFWAEIKCSRCNAYYHVGLEGRGMVGILKPYSINSLAPELRGGYVRPVPLSDLPLIGNSDYYLS